MVAKRYRLYIERMDASRNMARFYAMSIDETLFGQTCLIRRWGRIGTRGRMVQHLFDEEREAVRLFLELLRSKRKRGYRPRPASRHAGAAPFGDGTAAGVYQSRLGRDQMSRPSSPVLSRIGIQT